MNEDMLFDATEAMVRLFHRLSSRQQSRLTGSQFLAACNRVQDCLTRDGCLNDDDVRELARDILKAYRVAIALQRIHGSLDFANPVLAEALVLQLPRLFSNQLVTFNTTDFVLHCAGILRARGGRCVNLLPETSDKSPDLRVHDTCYVECKDLQSLSVDSLHQNIRDHLDKASQQLTMAQASNPLPFSMVCVDIPWTSASVVDVFNNAIGGIREALDNSNTIAFVILSRSGFRIVGDVAEFPHEWRLLWNPNAKCDILAARDYLSPVFPDFYSIRNGSLRHAFWPGSPPRIAQ